MRVCENPAALSVHQKSRAAPGTLLLVSEGKVDRGGNLHSEATSILDNVVATPSILKLKIFELKNEVGAFYWTVLAPDIVNPGREEQGLISVSTS